MSEKIHNVFVGAFSESDHLPIGAVRELWNPQVLIEKDREIANMEAQWRTELSQRVKQLWMSGVLSEIACGC
jgi:hypothetical protein